MLNKYATCSVRNLRHRKHTYKNHQVFPGVEMKPKTYRRHGFSQHKSAKQTYKEIQSENT